MASFSFQLPDGVTQMSYCVDERRRVNLLAQPADEDLHQFHVVLVFALPDALAQFGAREDAARLAHEHAQQSLFSRRKVNLARAAVQFAVGDLQSKVSYLELDWRFLRKAAAERAHSRYQFLHRKRLRQVIIRPESKPGYAIAHLAPRRQD